MSLIVEIKIYTVQKDQVKKINPDKRLYVSFKKPVFGSGLLIRIPGVSDYLDDSYTIEGKYIILSEEIKPSLQRFIRDLCKLEKRLDIFFNWVGETTENFLELTVDQFLALIKNDQIRNRSQYTLYTKVS